MNIQRWMARREKSWRQLEQLLNQAEKKGIQSLTSEQIRHLASLYRSVSADLARAKSHSVGQSVLQDLQRLTSRSYSQIYQGSRRQEWQALSDFCRYGFPEVVRQSWVYIALATLLFGLGGLLGWWYSWQDPAFMTLMLGASFVETVRETQELWTVSILGVEPVASSAIMINNIVVSLQAIIGGITMFMPEIPLLTPPGGFTVYLLVVNGLMIGSVGALVAQTNLAYDLWAFVFPHGALELPAIFFAGGAGLLLGRAILLPGQYRRRDALKVYGLQAAKLVYGIIPMLVIAGMIEGFFSPQLWIPNGVKYIVGTVIFVLLVQYCRRQRPLNSSVQGLS
ncbi:stage II sporulation protein M [Pseudanabaena sp. FACHB-2040]|uniref:stage II sporulation protein M n=1 Tax=Pseudanabaena sp. FACHB-2040 TaxID=2692859 RepID=UPI001682541A|nr:stage II sporulation protein M [Pseudanabaena sp. FACHB-2040]MBD2259137.1 stage II sporulation protein M [Pseudanabaena sp. FACHB-2040]